MSNNQQEIWKQKVELFRKRFGAREDVFGVKNTYYRKEFDKETQEIKRVEVFNFIPYCENFGSPAVCRITQGKGGCQDCDHKKYQRLTDEWIWKHISGQKDLLLYIVTQDGIKFGACDFDYGTHFENAKTIRDISLKYGLPCYIARSSKKGYHLYWFFSQPVEAHLFTSLVSYFYEESGFLARYRENIAIPLPEVFPKQTSFEESKLGNGIKPPMIEPKMRDGFNCWVDDQAVPYPFEEQWERLKIAKEITPEQLRKVLEDHKIPVVQAPVGRSAERVKARLAGKETLTQPSKPKGDFWQVVMSCPAMKQFWEKDADGTYKFDKGANENGVPHMARVASLSIAAATTNGLDVIRERWGSQRTEREIRYAVETTQHPWTCKALQDHGICRIGLHPIHKDHCLKKRPPAEMRNGVLVVNPNQLPESEWNEPSPYRFASGYMPLEEILRQLDDLFSFRGRKETQITEDGKQVEVEAKPPANLDEQVQELLKRIRHLTPDEQKQAQDHIVANKYMKVRALKSLEKQVHQEERDEQHKERCEEVPHFEFGGNTFFKQNNRYIMSYLDSKGMRHEVELTNFTVDIKEEIILLSGVDDDSKKEQMNEQLSFRGAVVVDGKTHPFTCVSNEWVRSGEAFFSLLTTHGGGSLLYNKSNYDHIRNCINHFSKNTKIIRRRVKDFGHYKIKGEHIFITPSVIVTRDQIKPNEHEYDLEFRDDTSKKLDFKIIDDDQFKDLALHIISDYFECNSRIATMTTFAHAMAASILSHIPLNKSPVLWINGSFSSGKSFVGEMAQNFYGNFDNLTGMGTTGKGKLLIAHNFRNALLVIDDFKSALSDHNAKQMIEFIHTAYDRGGRQASQRNGMLRENSTSVRGLIVTTGEDYPVQEASAISRMLLVSIESGQKNVEKGDRVKSRKHEYAGFTPHFIQFVYNMGEAEIRRIYRSYFEYFEKHGKEGKHEDSGHRIAENLAFNMTAFRLSMEMLLVKGVIPVQKKDEFCKAHLKNLEIIRVTISSNVRSQKGSTLFLEELAGLLQDPARYHIMNWHTFDPVKHGNSKALGFYRPRHDPDVVYIYAGVAIGDVEMAIRKQKNYLQSRQHIGRQLVEDGHIPPGKWDAKNSSFTKQVTTPLGVRAQCWVLKLESLGLTLPSSPPEYPKEPLTQPASSSDNQFKEDPLLDLVINE